MNPINRKICVIIEKAPRADKDELAQVLEDYAAKYGRTYQSLRRIPFVSDLLDNIEEITDARVEL